ncbi:hypothetical protein HZH68_000976 [Vespula germanica]|uniref:Uncharacterized protein n=1 Tax=Vespula germanica TaxID=30212 RepID=A0A834U6G3_VESGE|nr:hypothetical protein HZH68_000976 [Vespula germanica]
MKSLVRVHVEDKSQIRRNSRVVFAILTSQWLAHSYLLKVDTSATMNPLSTISFCLINFELLCGILETMVELNFFGLAMESIITFTDSWSIPFCRNVNNELLGLNVMVGSIRNDVNRGYHGWKDQAGTTSTPMVLSLNYIF